MKTDHGMYMSYEYWRVRCFRRKREWMKYTIYVYTNSSDREVFTVTIFTITLHLTTSLTLHFTTSHCISLASRYIPLHNTASHYISLHPTTVVWSAHAWHRLHICWLTDRLERWLAEWLTSGWLTLWQVGICENVAAGDGEDMFFNTTTKQNWFKLCK